MEGFVSKDLMSERVRQIVTFINDEYSSRFFSSWTSNNFYSNYEVFIRHVIFKQWIIDPNVSHNALCIPEVLCIKNLLT
jgi:hypothetical protein